MFRSFLLAQIARRILHKQPVVKFLKIWAIYHRLYGISAWKRGWSKVYFLTTRLFGQQWTKKWCWWLCEDEIAEFLTKTEGRKCKNTQNILLDWCYLLFEKYLQEKIICFYSENLPRYIIGLRFTEIPRGGKPEKSLEIFWMKNKTIFQFGIRAMKNYADLGGC